MLLGYDIIHNKSSIRCHQRVLVYIWYMTLSYKYNKSMNNTKSDLERKTLRPRPGEIRHLKTPIRDFRKLPRRNERVKLTNYNFTKEVYSSTSEDDCDDLLNGILEKQSQRGGRREQYQRKYIADGDLLQVEHYPRQSFDSEAVYLNRSFEDKNLSPQVEEENSTCSEPDVVKEIFPVEFDKGSISSRSTNLLSTKSSKKTGKSKASSPARSSISETDTESVSAFSERGLEEERFPSYLANSYRPSRKGTRNELSEDISSDRVSYRYEDFDSRNFFNKHHSANGLHHTKKTMETERRGSNSSSSLHSYRHDEKYSTRHIPTEDHVHKSDDTLLNKAERNAEQRVRSSRKAYYNKHIHSDPFEKQTAQILNESPRNGDHDNTTSADIRRSSEYSLSVNKVDRTDMRPQRHSLNDARLRRDELRNMRYYRHPKKSAYNQPFPEENVTYAEDRTSRNSIENEVQSQISESDGRMSRSSVHSRRSQQSPDIYESEIRSSKNDRRMSGSSSHSRRSEQIPSEELRRTSAPSIHSRRSVETVSRHPISEEPSLPGDRRKSRSPPASVNVSQSNNNLERKSTSSVNSHRSTQEVIPPTNSQPFTSPELEIINQDSNSIVVSAESTHFPESSSSPRLHTLKQESRRSKTNQMGDTDSIGSASSILLRATSRNSKSSGTRSPALVDQDEEILVGDEKDLHNAARSGDVETVDQLLELGTDINCRNKTDRTPIHWAAGNGHDSVLKIFLERDANIEAADKFGMNALLWAAWFGHPICVQMLLRAGANATAKNKNGFTFLHCAAQNNHQMVEHILTEDLQEFDRDITDDVGRTVLHVLAKHGRKEMMQKFVNLKCDLHIKDKAGNTPLHLAAKNGFYELLPILVEAGANSEEKNSDQKTAMHLAAEEGKSDTVEELIKLDADVNAETEDEICPLHLAVSGGHEETVITLINGGADVDAGNKHNQTPLHYAIVANRPPIVRALIMHDADPNIQDARRETPLHLAAENGYKDVAEILLHSNINLSLTDQRGKTPLDVAARGSYITVVDMIVKAQRHQLYLKSPSINHMNNGQTVESSELDDTADGLLKDISFEPDNSIETQHIRDLLFKLSNKYLKSEEWRKLAFHWGFTDSQVQAIEEQYTGKNSYREHGYRMLLIWLNGCTLRKETPVRSLFEALVAIQRREVAEIMRSKANSLPPDKSCIIS